MADRTDIYAGIACNVNNTTERHSYNDFGYYLLEADHGNPEPRVVSVEVPYAEHRLDFTRWHGMTPHKTRTIAYTFARRYADPLDRTTGRDEFVNWLWGIQGEWVRDDTLRHFPWWCDVCCSAVTVEEKPLGGLVTVHAEFTTYPRHAVIKGAVRPASDGSSSMQNWRL